MLSLDSLSDGVATVLNLLSQCSFTIDVEVVPEKLKSICLFSPRFDDFFTFIALIEVILIQETRFEVHFVAHGRIYFSLADCGPNEVDSVPVKVYSRTFFKGKDAKVLLCVRLLFFS